VEYFQAQYRVLTGDWRAYYDARSTRSDAQHDFVSLVSMHAKNDQILAIRVVSVWKCYDGEWRVKEVLEFKEC